MEQLGAGHAAQSRSHQPEQRALLWGVVRQVGHRQLGLGQGLLLGEAAGLARGLIGQQAGGLCLAQAGKPGAERLHVRDAVAQGENLDFGVLQKLLPPCGDGAALQGFHIRPGAAAAQAGVLPLEQQLLAALVGVDHLVVVLGIQHFQKLALLLAEAILWEQAFLVLEGVKEHVEQQAGELGEHILAPKGVAAGNAVGGEGQHLEVPHLPHAVAEGRAVQLSQAAV